MEHNWASENFPPAFADVVLHNLFGEEREVKIRSWRGKLIIYWNEKSELIIVHLTTPIT